MLWLVLGVNLSVASVKLLFGSWAGSLALVADGFHSLLDGSSNVVGLLGMRFAAQPPDAEHPYGHRRFESIAGFVIGLLIAGGMLEIGRALFESVSGARPGPEPSWLTAGAVVLTIGANLAISRYERHKGKMYRSSILTADAGHTLSDSFAAMAVLISLVGTAVGLDWADPVATLVVLGLVARTAWSVLRTNFGSLVDEAQLPPHSIREVVVATPGVYGAHKIRSRGEAEHVFVDLHIQVDPQASVERAHALTHRVADAIRAEFPNVEDVVIHTEPADGRERDLSLVAPGDHPPDAVDRDGAERVGGPPVGGRTDAGR